MNSPFQWRMIADFCLRLVYDSFVEGVEFNFRQYYYHQSFDFLEAEKIRRLRFCRVLLPKYRDKFKRIRNNTF